MKFRAVFTVLALLIISAVLFTGCPDNRETVRVLFYLDASNPTEVRDTNEWFTTFERNNPNVRIVRENLFDDAYHDKMRTYAAAGDLPEVMYVWPSGRSDYLHEGRLLKDLGPFIARDGLRNFYLPMTMDPSQQNSGYMAMIPQGVTNTHAFYINMEVLNEVGLQPARNYAELVAQVPILRNAGYQTILIPAESTWVMQSCLFSMIAGRFCGENWHERIHNGSAKFTDPDFVAALDFIRRLYADGVISREAVGVGYGDGPGMFAGNRGAYYIDGDWRVGDLLQVINRDRQQNIRISVFPDIAEAKMNRSNSSVVGVGYAMAASIPSGSAKEAAAWELVKWLLGKEVSTNRTENGGTPTPSRTDLDFGSMDLQPLSIAVGNIGREFDIATVVIDAVFHSDVFEPINNGLIQLALGTRTAAQVAADTQNAFDTWKSR
ncbi:MAG: extracellular solute-binding protein [Treponema sp.]|nr:extracellular solute-binding protein [Treponema sp.]